METEIQAYAAELIASVREHLIEEGSFPTMFLFATRVGTMVFPVAWNNESARADATTVARSIACAYDCECVAFLSEAALCAAGKRPNDTKVIKGIMMALQWRDAEGALRVIEEFHRAQRDCNGQVTELARVSQSQTPYFAGEAMSVIVPQPPVPVSIREKHRAALQSMGCLPRPVGPVSILH
jgi:hypothetical protein